MLKSANLISKLARSLKKLAHRPHEQLVVKVEGSRRLTLRNRIFVRELDPGKTSLEDQPLKTNTEPLPVPITGKKKRTRQTPSAIPNHIPTDSNTRASAVATIVTTVHTAEYRASSTIRHRAVTVGVQ